MPRKTIQRHGTQAQQQSQVEYYKDIKNYKSLLMPDDELNKLIKDIYNNNIWNLKETFSELKEYYEQINISTKIAWEEGIQYLDYPNASLIKNLSLSKGEIIKQ